MTNNISIKRNKSVVEIRIGDKTFEFDTWYNIKTLHIMLQNAITAAYNQGQVDLSIDLTNAMWEEQIARNREPSK